MDEVLGDLQNNKFRRTQVTNNADGAQNDVLKLNDMGNKGEIIISEHIKFENVPILSPNGDVLIPQMNFEIKPGMHLFIQGPNGCGKSSLFRIMGQLWPVTAGVLHKPNIDKIFYIPQRPYLPNGTLRDQLIYPESIEEYNARGQSDDDLFELLKEVRLGYLVDREGGWDKENDWNDVLSGGEKQRMAMGRLIYHKPTYAILDECTSAVSMEVEGHLYTYMKQ